MPRTLILSIGLVCGLCFAPGRAADVPAPTLKSSQEWTQWRGADRSGKSPDTGLIQDWTVQPPKLLWTAAGMGSGYASMSVGGGRIYTTGGGESGQMTVCINAADGKVVWTKKVAEGNPRNGNYPGMRCTPSLEGDRLYVIASTGTIACLKSVDGSEVWSKDFAKEWNGKMMSGWGFSESPLVDGDWVLCTPGAANAMIVALDKLTGKEIWRTSVPTLGDRGKDGAGYSSIVISNACGVKQYVQLVGRGVIGVRAADGKLLWDYNRVANGTANISTPIVSGDLVFCSTGYRTGAALLQLVKRGSEIECQERYFLDGNLVQNHHGQMILKDGFLYFGNGHRNGLPICVEMETGKIVWGGSERGPGSNSAAIAYADGNLIFRYESGEVALIEATPSAYRLKGHFKPDYVSRNPCWSHPVVIGGRMYLRDQDKLMCYEVRAK